MPVSPGALSPLLPARNTNAWRDASVRHPPHEGGAADASDTGHPESHDGSLDAHARLDAGSRDEGLPTSPRQTASRVGTRVLPTDEATLPPTSRRWAAESSRRVSAFGSETLTPAWQVPRLPASPVAPVANGSGHLVRATIGALVVELPRFRGHSRSVIRPVGETSPLFASPRPGRAPVACRSGDRRGRTIPYATIVPSPQRE